MENFYIRNKRKHSISNSIWENLKNEKQNTTSNKYSLWDIGSTFSTFQAIADKIRDIQKGEQTTTIAMNSGDLKKLLRNTY